MNHFQQQFQKHLGILDDLIHINLSQKQKTALSQNITEDNFLPSLKKATQAEKIRLRPVQLSFQQKHFIKTPLLVLKKDNSFAVMIYKNHKNWFVDEYGQLSLVSDFENIEYFIQFYPAVSLNSIKGLISFFFQSTSLDLKKNLLISLILTFLSALLPLCFTGMINSVVPFQDLQLWAQISILLVAIAIITTGFEVIRRLFLLQMILARNKQTQASLWSKLLSFYPKHFSKYSIMDNVLAAQSIDQIRDVIDINLVSNFFNFLFSLTLIMLLFYYSPLLTFIFLIFLFIASICFYIFSQKMNAYIQRSQQIRVLLSQFTLDIFRGIEKIKLTKAENSILSKWLSIFLEKKQADIAASQQFNHLTLIISTLLASLSFCFFYVFSWDINIVPLDKFIGFSITYGILIKEIATLLQHIPILLLANSLINRSKIITDEQSIEKVKGIRPIQFTGNLEIENLSIDIEEQRIVSRVSFKVNAGQTVAIVGLSGSGKTTLLRSLVGLEKSSPQSIIIDDIPLENLNLSWYRIHCGVILQNSQLLNGNILDNISLGEEFHPEEINKLCHQLNMLSWVNHLPMNIYTRCMGAQELVSGGQKQLILLARALIRKPQFLFLDEATSALDNTTQQAVVKTLQESEATKIIIAHRLETIQWVNHILVLEEGKIIEKGSFQELLSLNGKFAQLAHYQKNQTINNSLH